jgi:hypothetical protein
MKIMYKHRERYIKRVNVFYFIFRFLIVCNVWNVYTTDRRTYGYAARNHRMSITTLMLYNIVIQVFFHVEDISFQLISSIHTIRSLKYTIIKKRNAHNNCNWKHIYIYIYIYNIYIYIYS